MTDPTHNYISEDRILTTAGDLLSDHNDAPIWDDAIATLVAHLLGRPDEVAAVHTHIIRYNARRPDARRPDAPDEIWARLSDGAKRTWVLAMMPTPEYDDRAWDPSDERAAENRRLAQDAYEDEHGI